MFRLEKVITCLMAMNLYNKLCWSEWGDSADPGSAKNLVIGWCAICCRTGDIQGASWIKVKKIQIQEFSIPVLLRLD